jgi:hypothetical protein
MRWWSRLARASSHTFGKGRESPCASCSSRSPKTTRSESHLLLLRAVVPEFDETWVRFVDGRPMSGITTRFLSWCSSKLEAVGKKVWVLLWDNASWHISHEVREWIDSHNRAVKRSAEGVRIISCVLPKKSPWLEPVARARGSIP